MSGLGRAVGPRRHLGLNENMHFTGDIHAVRSAADNLRKILAGTPGIHTGILPGSGAKSTQQAVDQLVPSGFTAVVNPATREFTRMPNKAVAKAVVSSDMTKKQKESMLRKAQNKDKEVFTSNKKLLKSVKQDKVKKSKNESPQRQKTTKKKNIGLPTIKGHEWEDLDSISKEVMEGYTHSINIGDEIYYWGKGEPIIDDDLEEITIGKLRRKVGGDRTQDLFDSLYDGSLNKDDIKRNKVIDTLEEFYGFERLRDMMLERWKGQYGSQYNDGGEPMGIVERGNETLAWDGKFLYKRGLFRADKSDIQGAYRNLKEYWGFTILFYDKFNPLVIN